MSKLDSFIWNATIEAYCGKLVPWGTGIIRRPSKEELNKYFIAATGTPYDKTVHWCGIFQVYLLKKAGVACGWNREIVDESGGKDLEIVKGDDAKKGLAFGDIVRVQHNQHHLMVLEPAQKGFIRSIEGNAGGIEDPMIAAHWTLNKHNVVEEIQYRYRVIA